MNDLICGFTDLELLAELIKRNVPMEAPRQTTRSPGYSQSIVGVGNDEIATIEIHDDALDYLKSKGHLDLVSIRKRMQINRIISKVLHAPGSSKKAKTRRGSALTQK